MTATMTGFALLFAFTSGVVQGSTKAPWTFPWQVSAHKTLQCVILETDRHDVIANRLVEFFP